MALQDLNRRHWLLIGAIVGGLLTYSRLFDLTTGRRITPDEQASQQTQKLTPEALLVALRQAPVQSKEEQAEIIVYPEIGGSTYLLGRLRVANIEGGDALRDLVSIVPASFKDAESRGSIRETLSAIARSNSHIQYRVAWWATPAATAAIWGGGALLLIGVIWPSLISLAVGAGFAPKPRSREERKRDAAYLASSKSAPDPDASAKPKPLVQEERKELERLTHTLQKNLELTEATPAQSPSVTQSASPVIRKLDSGPVEAPTLAEAPKEDVDWSGQFYPVSHPKHKPQELLDHKPEEP